MAPPAQNPKTLVTSLQLVENASSHSRGQLLEALEELETGCWQLVKHNDRNTIARHSGLGLFYKDFTPDTSLKGQLKALAGQDPLSRSLRGAQLLGRHNFLAPSIVATGERKGRPFILMTEVTGPQLHNALNSFLTHPRGSRLQWKRKLLHSLGREVGRLHRTRIAHGDLRPNNIILHVEQGVLNFGFIDNERTRKPLQFERERRRNLTQLMLISQKEITVTDRLRFFRAYFESCPMSEPSQRQLLKAISRSVTERMRGNPPPTGTPIDDQWWQYLNQASAFSHRQN